MPKMKACAGFDDYLRDQSPASQVIIRALRRFVRSAEPQLSESVKWGNGCWLAGTPWHTCMPMPRASSSAFSLVRRWTIRAASWKVPAATSGTSRCAGPAILFALRSGHS